MKSPSTLLSFAVAALTSSLAFGQTKKAVAPTVDFASMVQIDASSFKMGSPDAKASPYGDAWFVDQQPQHSVNLGEYWIDRREVTAEQFALFLSYAGGEAYFHPDQPIERVHDGYLPVAGSEPLPMVQVTWQAASHYCAWAGKRLPTEAEWERAAAGSEGRTYPWGNDGPNCEKAVFFSGNSFCETSARWVGDTPAGATPDGILDLAGNVAEWTADWYDLYSKEEQTNPTGPEKGTLRVVRGGGFLDTASWVRNQARWGANPAGRSDNVGFRCAWSVGETSPVPRGAIFPPADVDRKPSPRPRAKFAPEPESLVKRLQGPTGIVSLGSQWYVIETAAHRVSSIDQATFQRDTVLGALESPARLATDGTAVYVTDTNAGKVWRALPGQAASLVAQWEDGPKAIVARDGNVFWANAKAIRVMRIDADSPKNLLKDLDNVVSLALSSTHLYFAEAGTAASHTRIGRVPIEGGALEVIVDSSLFLKTYGSGPYLPADLSVDENGGMVYFVIRAKPWQYVTLTHSVPLGGGKPTLYGYSAPSGNLLGLGEGSLYWSSRPSLHRIDLAAPVPYQHVATWTSVGGILMNPGSVIWTDSFSGRLLRTNP